MRKRVLVRTCHFAELRNENYVRLSEHAADRADGFCSILDPVDILPPDKPTNIGYQRKKKRLRSCRPPIPVMQTGEAGTGDHRRACRWPIFHRTAIRSVFI